MSTSVTNGRPRKQLADQLDRLDRILDGLAEALNEAVADAARDGARQAAREVLAEVLTNPDLRALIARGASPPPKPSRWARLRAKLAELRAWVVAATGPIRARIADACAAARPAVSKMVGVLGLGWRLRAVAVAALAVGAVTAALCYAAPHGVAAVVAGVGGAATGIAGWAGLRFRSLARGMGLV